MAIASADRGIARNTIIIRLTQIQVLMALMYGILSN